MALGQRHERRPIPHLARERGEVSGARPRIRDAREEVERGGAYCRLPNWNGVKSFHICSIMPPCSVSLYCFPVAASLIVTV